MTTARAIVTAAAIALLGLGACSKDKSKPDPKPADAAPAKVADAAAAKPDAAPSAADAAAAPGADAAAGDGDGDGSGDGDGDTTGDTTGDSSKVDPEQPTNIKLLPKSWKVSRIKKLMKSYNKALGVKCDFCHDPKDFASDANKHKPVARKMMRMTQSMNKKFFKGKQELTCMTCHRGSEHPE